MKAEKKASKEKSKTERRIMEGEPKLELITEWNIKRILVALIVLILLIALPAYYLNSSDNSTTTPEPSSVTNSNHQDSLKAIVAKRPPIKVSAHNKTSEPDLAQSPIKKTVLQQKTLTVKPDDQTPTKQLAENSDAEKISEEISDAETIHPSVEIVEQTEAIPQNSHINRAQLAEGVNNKEPFGQVKIPLIVNSSKAQSITYFTEISDFKGNTVFHEWLKEGNTIFKREIVIRGNRWRISTSKLFTLNSVGLWQVRIITEQGEILHKIDFLVEN